MSAWQEASKTFRAALVTIAAALAISAGCGTSSGSAALTGNLGFQAVAISGYQAFRGQADFPYTALRLALPKTSPFLRGGQQKPSAALSTTAPVFFDELNLYVTEVDTSTTTTLSFYTDAAGTIPAGSVVLSGVQSSLGNYASYPATLNGTIDITAGNLPCTGTVAITIVDGTGNNTLKGNLTLPNTKVAISFDFTLDDSGNVGGSSTIVEHGSTISLTGIQGLLGADSIAGNVTVEPSGWSGTGTFSLVTGEFSVTLQTETGTSQASTNADGGLDMVFGDGTRETVSLPLITQGDVPLSGSDAGTAGSDAGAFTSVEFPLLTIEAKSADGRFGGVVPDSKNNSVPGYIAPGSGTVTMLNTAGNAFGRVYGINVHGAIVGTVSTDASSYNFDRPAYWASPAAAPSILQLLDGDIAAIAVGINDSGEIVAAGYSIGDTFHHHLIYYSSPTAAPVALSTVGVAFAATSFLTDEGFPQGINNRGEIIGGYLYDNGSGHGLQNDSYVWSSPSANPVKLALPAGDTGSQVTALNESGAIVGNTSPDYTGKIMHAVLWASSSAPPTVLGGFNGEALTSATDINAGGAIVGCSGTLLDAESVRPGLEEDPAQGEVIDWTSATHAAGEVSPGADCRPFISDTFVVANVDVILTPK
jgi:hypothetical protein